MAQAKILRTIEILRAAFLNDVAAAPNGDLFVSDFQGNRTYHLGHDRKPAIGLEGETLQNPNGLTVDGGDLVIAKSRKLTPPGSGSPIASFHGVVKVGADYWATDWPGGRLLRISNAGDVQVVMSGFYQLADLGYDPGSKTIAMPIMSDNRLVFLRLGALDQDGTLRPRTGCGRMPQTLICDSSG